MVKKILAQAYLWILLLLLYSPIVIIVIYSFTEAKVWATGRAFPLSFIPRFSLRAHITL